MKLQLVRIVWSKKRKTEAAKNTNRVIRRWSMIENFKWRVMLKEWCGESVNKIYNILKSIWPEGNRNLRLS